MNHIEAMKQAQALRELADRFSEGWHDGIKIDASDIMLLAMAASAIEQAEKREPWPEEPAGHKSGGVQPPLQEPVACKHEWFSTGAMEPGECRCILCGKWGSVIPPAAQPAPHKGELK
jgi:hypothetical protein